MNDPTHNLNRILRECKTYSFSPLTALEIKPGETVVVETHERALGNDSQLD